MLASFAELLNEHRRRGAAVGAFTCYNFETAFGVLRAAGSRGCVILVSGKTFRSDYGEQLVAGLRAVAERSPTPACLQLDHTDDIRLIEAALELGVGAVMADGSRLPFGENAEFVREAVALAARYGAQVEAELGGIEGDEDVAAAVAAGALTDPEEAAAFAERTGAACLAVSIGNVHGTYRHPPALDWPRLKEICARTDVPLSLHGASGLPDADLRRAIDLKISKVNVNTELRERYLDAVAGRVEEARSGFKVADLNLAAARAVEETATAKLALYGQTGSDPTDEA